MYHNIRRSLSSEKQFFAWCFTLNSTIFLLCCQRHSKPFSVVDLILTELHKREDIARVITNIMERSPSSEADSSSAGPEIQRLLWKPEVDYRVRKSQPLIHVFIPMNNVYNHHSFFRSILIITSYLLPFLPSDPFPSFFPTKNPVCIFLLRYACHGLKPFYPPWFDHPYKTWYTQLKYKFWMLLVLPSPHPTISYLQYGHTNTNHCLGVRKVMGSLFIYMMYRYKNTNTPKWVSNPHYQEPYVYRRGHHQYVVSSAQEREGQWE